MKLAVDANSQKHALERQISTRVNPVLQPNQRETSRKILKDDLGHNAYNIRKVSMTSLLMHNVEHSTRHSFTHKTNNQPLKKFLSLAFSFQKMSIKKCAPKIIFFNENFFRKIRIIFDIENWLLAKNFAIFDNFYSTDSNT